MDPSKLLNALEPDHLLLIGCSGMLSGAARELARDARRTTIIGRDAGRAHSATGPAASATFVSANWRSPEDLIHRLQERVVEDGPFDLALLWIHDSGREVWAGLDACMAPYARVFEVLGSASKNPAELEDHGGLFERHRRIVLGHETSEGERRWLTHAEISAGALRAVRDDRSVIVGRV